ncbi:MAG: aminodeoxychorismate synthase component I [Lentisphaerae bacterium]|jgi:para-aminobenzoate synthetase / 4-amino-4-deoxychorismate lyase|nr:aminodeoxychorismate synthase component I [Lentisphaerota bacterium]MBT4822486.1 aminodeoxychorismate synthase component I [Lentisphaerota bacterium]MBT5612799.1 aminodeoxychorismate synthase component I [Lentisphaerota bacterium]MBT7057625.1 aminodeoxychorismate synthase component I [Lentisphaerota bacterium]MBT7844928.1 aminodeoxychorismate synthase component I [Lentisphaerota bacterium]
MTHAPEQNSVLLHDTEQQCWLCFSKPLEIHVASDVHDVIPALSAVERRVSNDGLFAAGFVSYDAAPAMDAALPAKHASEFPLLWFGIYDKPARVSGPRPADDTPMPPIKWEPSVDRPTYDACMARIRRHIEAGDIYQVNYTHRLAAELPIPAWNFFARMIRAQGAGYGAYLDVGRYVICSASPELFLHLDGKDLTSRPMKGTMPRGLGAEHDRQYAINLRESEKEQAENVMILDMVRNDLGRVATPGSVTVPSLFDIEQYPTLWQMTSTVRCHTSAGITDIFRATFPPASITGAPKRRSMQIINDIEPTPRKLYTGAIGYIAPDRRAQFNVAIRTILVDRETDVAEYGVGGGIVWDSKPQSEFEECTTKAQVLVQSQPEFRLLETLLWEPGDGLFLLERHLDRLRGSADYFGRKIDITAILHTLHTATAGLPQQGHKVRLLVGKDGTPECEATPLAPLPQPWRLGLAKSPVNRQDSFVYHKTTHRDVYEKAKQEGGECHDVLLWNTDSELTESCIANVALELEGVLCTPPVHSGLLAGTYRAELLEKGEITEKVLRVTDLENATRIVLLNSVRKCWDAVLVARTEPRTT